MSPRSRTASLLPHLLSTSQVLRMARPQGQGNHGRSIKDSVGIFHNHRRSVEPTCYQCLGRGQYFRGLAAWNTEEDRS